MLTVVDDLSRESLAVVANNSLSGIRFEATEYANQIAPAIQEAFVAGARTTRDIADRLNEAGLPSRQGGRWHPANIARVLRYLGGWSAILQGMTSPGG